MAKPKPPKLSREDRVRGGRTTTPARKLSAMMAARKKCAKSCPLYPCPLVPLVDKKKKTCALRDTDPSVKRNIIRKAILDRSSYAESLISKVNDMELLLHRVKSLKEEMGEHATPEQRLNQEMKLLFVLKQVIEVEKDIGKFIYGDKQIIETTGEQLIKVRWMTEAEAEEEQKKCLPASSKGSASTRTAPKK